MSVGGGDSPFNADVQFSQLAGSKAHRTTIINSVIAMLRNQHLHGFDIDW